ncbi:hypothetical protein Zmor_008844 [Zophobas morio]|uniref:Phorbol-ester/DAG-type domain-containing protein n=2 Tax=Zophobas morio TaxID=2755281 RepID=A0AA38HHX5_9CUCU|nr:hypothetical protein Zmor_008844 [Zophobas morio]
MRRLEKFVSYYDLFFSEQRQTEVMNLIRNHDPTILNSWTGELLHTLKLERISTLTLPYEWHKDSPLRLSQYSLKPPCVAHIWTAKTYCSPTSCHFCNTGLMGLIKQGYRCSRCKLDVHRMCTNAMVGFRCLVEKSNTKAVVE